MRIAEVADLASTSSTAGIVAVLRQRLLRQSRNECFTLPSPSEPLALFL